MKTYACIILSILFIFGCSARRNNAKSDRLSRPDLNYYGLTVDTDADGVADVFDREPDESFNTENYNHIEENDFLLAIKNPQSTFSIDVDAASYSNTRRYITGGQLPPKDAVRIEEMINYFTYNYPDPDDQHPFSISTELADCPWNTENKLLSVGIQGKRIENKNIPASNLVFLLDVSGSMDSPDKLPLLKSSFNLLLNQLGADDQIAVVVYAGAAGLVLPSTSCDQKEKIRQAIEELDAGGATAGGEGIELAYKVAKENFKKGGNNRIILATDGDFNVGISSEGELVRLIEKKRESGIFLSVLGFGTGNLQDAKMEQLADKGNGNFYYIDNLYEAKKVLVTEMGSTLLAIAKDVKIQLEFNPAKVAQYRLIGYENRMLQNKDFEDDKKDAGELGAGHSVTALYEIVPQSGTAKGPNQIENKYQVTKVSSEAHSSNEMATLRFRYKLPKDSTSNLIETVILNKSGALKNTTSDYRFASAVAEFSLLLRDSKHKGSANYEQVIALATEADEGDDGGYRSEFVKLVKAAKDIAESK